MKRSPLIFLVSCLALVVIGSALASAARAPVTRYAGKLDGVKVELVAGRKAIKRFSVRALSVCDSGYHESGPYKWGYRPNENPVRFDSEGRFSFRKANPDNGYLLVFRGRRTPSKISGVYGYRSNVFDECFTGKSYRKFLVRFLVYPE